MRRILFGLILGFTPWAGAAVTGTATITSDTPRIGESVRATTIAWDADGSGNCTQWVEGVAGQVVRIYIDPGANSSAPTGVAPSASYDVTLRDAYGFDALRGTGANLSATVNKSVSWPSSGEWVQSTLTLAVTNAGASGEGTIRLVTRR